MLRNSQDHMRKIRKRKLNHLFINIPSTIPQIFQSSHRVNVQLGNNAGFLRTEITPLTSEIAIHIQYDRKHAFCKRRPRLRTAVESKSVSTQGRSLFSSRPSVQRIQGKRGLC